MEQSDWQYTNSQQQRQRMPDTPPHQNARRHSHQAPQQSSIQSQPPQSANSSQYSYTTPTRLTASPSSRHSITSDFSGINIRDDSHPSVDKSARPNLAVHPGGLRPAQPNHQSSIPSSPTRQNAAVYNTANYPGNPSHPGIGRTSSDHYIPQASNSRHPSPMHTVSPTMSPYYSTTPHMLSSINEGEQTMQWSQTRQSPSRAPYAFPTSRDSVSPRTQLHNQQSPTHNRHSMPHIPQYDTKSQYSPRQTTHFPGNAAPSSPNISPSAYSPRHPTFTINRDPGSMMADIVYTNPPPAKFRLIQNANDLNPAVNTQPKFRRANPDGGFISVPPSSRIV